MFISTPKIKQQIDEKMLTGIESVIRSQPRCSRTLHTSYGLFWSDELQLPEVGLPKEGLRSLRFTLLRSPAELAVNCCCFSTSSIAHWKVLVSKHSLACIQGLDGLDNFY